jgi:hypothetical protein
MSVIHPMHRTRSFPGLLLTLAVFAFVQSAASASFFP